MNSETTLNSTLTIDGILIPVQPSATHEWTVSTSQAATGYGVSESALSHHKQRHADELIEGKHFITVETINGGGPDDNLSSGRSASNRGNATRTLWTKRGVVRLGFFIKSERAKKFRDLAEDLIIQVGESKGSAVAGPLEVAQLVEILVQLAPALSAIPVMAETLGKLVDRMERLESAHGPVPLCELTANPSALTERQTSVLHHLEYVARPLIELGLEKEIPVLNALERAGLARKTGTGWGRIRRAA